MEDDNIIKLVDKNKPEAEEDADELTPHDVIREALEDSKEWEDVLVIGVRKEDNIHDYRATTGSVPNLLYLIECFKEHIVRPNI